MNIGDIKQDRDEVACPVIWLEQDLNNAHIEIGCAYNSLMGLVTTARDEVPGNVALYTVSTDQRWRIQRLRTICQPILYYYL
ncbi:hypothetical protein F4823DRAFT_601830 [Ustulina deusta]|nr:hypothetical protein F4823DRAFT_601830 [Ustulina deusta]